MAEPPLLAGAVQVTVADALPAVAVPIVGAPGAVATAAMVVLVSTGGAPYRRDAVSGRVVSSGHDGGDPLGVFPSHGGVVVVLYNPALGHPMIVAVMDVPKSVMFAPVLNSNWAHLRTVPAVPDAVKVTVMPGVVNVAPAGI